MTVDVAVSKLSWLLAHPEAVADGKPCSAGEAAEYRHLLFDADPDASTPALPYPAPKEAK